MRSLYFLILLLVLSSCKEAPVSEAVFIQFRGETMGTYYAVSYTDSLARNFQQSLDSLLVAINEEVSTYIPTSTISRFNQSESGLEITGDINKVMLMSADPKDLQSLENWHFLRNYGLSMEIRNLIGPAFDPTVMPLVNYWGFGYTPHEAVTAVDSFRVDSLLGFVGFDMVKLENQFLSKKEAGAQLDFSAVAKGYAVDELGRFIEERGINNYLVEIGGEVRSRGESPRGGFWKIGINTPAEGAATTDYELVVNLDDKSLATSGNYRNFHEVNGVKYAHTINPTTGYPERNQLLSVSVFADDCAIADGLATGFMVMGLEAAKEKLSQLEEIEACLIYGEEDGSLSVYITPGIEDYIESIK